MRVNAIVVALLCAASTVHAEVPTPARPVTDPKAIASPANPAARPVPIDDLGYSRGLLSTVWSADGRQLFLSTNFTGRYNIWRTEASGSWPVQLTQADDRQSGLLVSPDGRTVYFNQDNAGDEEYDIYAVPAAGGPVTDLTNTPDIREGATVMAPDGRSIAITYKPKARGQTDMGLLDLATGKVRLLTHEADPQWDWTPIAFVEGGKALIAERSFTDQTAGEVWKVDVATGKATKLLGKPKTIYYAADATKDGNTLAISSNDGTGQMHAGVYSVATGSFRWLKPTPWEQTASAISPDGKSMVVGTGIDGRTELSLVTIATMAERTLPLPPGSNDVAGTKPFSPDSKKLLVIQTGATSPGAPVIIDLATGKVAAPIQLAMASLDPATLPRSAIVTYKSFDGTLVSAVLTIPFNLKRDGSNPAVVMPHGGPTGQTTDYFNKTATALASRGYFVIQPNPRGSTGYGQAFQKANYQDLGGGDLKDELAAKDFLVASGYVDPKRVGITGGSYGGFMTLMAIGRAPDAFAAAVQEYGIIDWRTMWSHEDAGLQAYQKSLLGDPATYPKVYDASSPLTYIKDAKAPLLSLQGENDIRVPRGQAQQVTDAIKAKGGVAEVVYYPAEGHGFAKRENQVDSLKRTIDWFDKYLKK
ncbi:S9 family peptidase [Sphingomonas sp. CGMCC 1.13654]|uniref:Acyl-peptide hydrolase n=1 Tax=Sphingomonas chungangi TaxID=2683589 RepID=A0A838L4K5_9SPHN|nr:S9 family peptidase [Sphingomonas chungangi]MBA2934301.1 S9 family peptidase [Sphingomonas chungangi]MVW57342.1 alpha/beta fold hydrolase [Sphingomonas chungangi]